MKDTTFILFPEYAKLKSEVEKLRTELSMLVLERDELQYVTCVNIETAYMLELGALEYKAYEFQCTALRMKRKAELIRAKKNRQETVDIRKIEDTLDDEFAEYQAKRDEQIKKMNDALTRSKFDVLSDKDSAELKKLYQLIVKALHPDLNPDVSEAQLQLFYNAVDAYKNGNLNALRIIGEMVGTSQPIVEDEDALETLRKEHDRLVVLVKGISEDITAIKGKYPYTMKSIIEDNDKKEEKRNDLNRLVDEYNKRIAYYSEEIDEMLR